MCKKDVPYYDRNELAKVITDTRNFLVGNHSGFLLCDDGTHGQCHKDTALRSELEKYLRNKTIKNPETNRGIFCVFLFLTKCFNIII